MGCIYACNYCRKKHPQPLLIASIDPKKNLPHPLLRPQASRNRKSERGYLGNYQRERIGI